MISNLESRIPTYQNHHQIYYIKHCLIPLAAIVMGVGAFLIVQEASGSKDAAVQLDNSLRRRPRANRAVVLHRSTPPP